MASIRSALGIRMLGLLLPVSLLAAADQEASLSAVRKFQKIGAGEYPSGTSVVVTQDEMNAFLQFHAAAAIPEGVRNPELEFRNGGAVIKALVDLEKAGASAEDLPVLMRLLLRGERNIAVDVDYAVSDGQAVTKVVSLTIEESQISGAVMEWFLDSFAPAELRPYLTGERAIRQAGVREAALEPGRAVVVVE